MGRAQLGAGDTGRRGAEDTVRPVAEEEADRGSTEDTTRPNAGGKGRTGGAASERFAGQVEGEGPALKLTEAGARRTQ